MRRKIIIVILSILLIILLAVGYKKFFYKEPLTNKSDAKAPKEIEKTGENPIFMKKDDIKCPAGTSIILLYSDDEYEYYYDQNSTCNVIIKYNNKNYTVKNAIDEKIIDINFIINNGIKLNIVEKETENIENIDKLKILGLVKNVYIFDNLMNCENDVKYLNVDEEFSESCKTTIYPKELDFSGKATLYFNTLNSYYPDATISLETVNKFLNKYYDTSLGEDKDYSYSIQYNNIGHKKGTDIFNILTFQTNEAIYVKNNYYNEITNFEKIDNEHFSLKIKRLYLYNNIITDGYYNLKNYKNENLNMDNTIRQLIEPIIKYKLEFEIKDDNYILTSYSTINTKEEVLNNE